MTIAATCLQPPFSFLDIFTQESPATHTVKVHKMVVILLHNTGEFQEIITSTAAKFSEISDFRHCTGVSSCFIFQQSTREFPEMISNTASKFSETSDFQHCIGTHWQRDCYQNNSKGLTSCTVIKSARIRICNCNWSGR